MTDKTNWVVDQRGASLAIMILTRATNVVVIREPAEYKIDYLVEIDDASKISGTSRFGVEVKASNDMSRFVRKDGVVAESTAKQLIHLAKEIPFPVGVLLIDVKKEEGRFGWVKAPLNKPGTKSMFVSRRVIETRPTNRADIEQIVNEVTCAYAATPKKSRAGRSGRPKHL